ncbi:MAG: hypothetical protein ACQER7_09960 [Bacteroidota bacterium]
MKAIKKQYVTDENNNVVAVQMDIETFEKIERVLEDYALGKLIEENDEKDNLDLNEARRYYNKLNKK